MTDWQDISTAPKNGETITVKRVYEGRIVYEGPGAWREHVVGPSFCPLTGEQFGWPGKSMRWKYPEGHEHAAFCVPEPTHWRG